VISREQSICTEISVTRKVNNSVLLFEGVSPTLEGFEMWELNRNRLESWKHCCFFFAVYHRMPERYFVYLTLLSNFKWISELMERPLSVVPTFQEAIWNSSIHGIWVHEVSTTFVFFPSVTKMLASFSTFAVFLIICIKRLNMQCLLSCAIFISLHRWNCSSMTFSGWRRLLPANKTRHQSWTLHWIRATKHSNEFLCLIIGWIIVIISAIVSFMLKDYI